jgi:serine/threonine protein kinase
MEMAGAVDAQRWHGQKSSFPWEQDALNHVRSSMPAVEPYRAWQTFTFTGPHGHVREVDLLLAAPGGLFLVEIKSHPGRAANRGSTWLFRDGTTTRTIENPLHFTDQKAKELRSQLQRAAGGTLRVPRIEAAVFLSADNLECEFDEFQRQRVYGRDGKEGQTHLDGIWHGFLSQPPPSEKNRVTPGISRQLPRLLAKIGIGRLHKIGKIGPYDLAPRAFDTGPTWADYLAENPSLPDDQPRRVRVYLSELGASDDDRKSTQRAARREYLSLQGITHEGIVSAEQYSDELLVGPAVVFRHGRDWRRLDHFMATRDGAGLPLDTRLEMIRQLAEALDHAHRRHLYHRALAPRSVYVQLDGRYPRLRIADWQIAAHPRGTRITGVSGSPRGGTISGGAASTLIASPAALIRHIEGSASAYLAPEFYSPDAPASLLDVFGLGALSYLILTGVAPAASREELEQLLSAEHALAPSGVTDAVTPALDELVSKATAVSPPDRTGAVREFLKALDAIEKAFDAPADSSPATDPLKAAIGDEIAGWTVERVLGKGSTSRALLVSRGDENDRQRRVFKVALNDAAAQRLEREAAQLAPLKDSHVAALLDQPFEAGPPEHRRKLIGVEYVGDHTLAEELRERGPLAMTIGDLERLGEDLFQALRFLEGQGIWHRDIKPENLAIRDLKNKKGRELVLFDFSLAGTPDTELSVGTRDYLDPFLGTGRRTRYDQAAELYAVAVTLHEMVSGELPSWGDDILPVGFLDPEDEVQLAEDVFDSVIRDGLVGFFRQALHRDAAQRFASLRAMTRAWTKIFEDIATVPPLTTASTEGGSADITVNGDGSSDLSAQDVQAKLDAAARSATPDTPLVAAGLTQYALSIALRHLDVSTAGELAKVPARRITTMKGVGRDPRYELVRRSRDWRRQFQFPDTDFARPGQPRHQESEKPGGSERGRLTADGQPSSAQLPIPGSAGTGSASPESANTTERLAHLSVDEVVTSLVPAVPALLQVAGLDRGPTGGQASPWASREEIAAVTGLPAVEVAASQDRLRARWAKTARPLLSVRDDVVDILRARGRILGADQLSAALLARRGSGRDDPQERLVRAAVCVRAAVEAEERLEAPRLLSRRHHGTVLSGSTVLIALAQDEADAAAPSAADLFAYAELLGEVAGALAKRDPLPGVTEIRQALREVPTADQAPRLSDTDLVLLAAAASENASVTARFELYPRDLPADRALKISQAVGLLGIAKDTELVARVLARFPDLSSPPRVEDIPGLLAELKYDIERRTDGLLHLRSSTVLSTSRTRAGRTGGTDWRTDAVTQATQRFHEARRHGGFVAVKAHVATSSAVCAELASMDGVRPVDVTAEFISILRAVTQEQGRPRWEVVLAADSPDASPAARFGLAALLTKTWERLEASIRSNTSVANGGDSNNGADSSIVLLHDATPLARFAGGMDLMARLAVAARDAAESPRGLWLLCPMADPKAPPRLDGLTVGVIPGDVEQLAVPAGFGLATEITLTGRGKAS